MKAWLSSVMVAAGVLTAGLPLAAHHSFSAEYDANKLVKLRGSVTGMDWVNPHCWIHLDVTQPDGEVESWMIEGGAPNALLRLGWTKRTLLPGTQIVVEGYRAKNGKQMVSGRDVTFPDGRKLFGGSSRREKIEITEGWPDDPPQ
jgi:hypothetical protein